MKASPCLLIFLLLLAATIAGGESGSGAGRQLPLGWTPSLSGCRRSVAECLAGADEFDLGSGASLRRALIDASVYISYSALLSDSVPCSIPGASYYNCQPGADANPYSRSCSAITQCRG